MFQICSLCSGSRGNCIYLEVGGRSFLIDAGGCARYIEESLDKLFSKSIFDIDAVFVSHEHLDHISALSQFAFKYKIPVVCNLNTAKSICYHFEKEIPNLGIFVSDNVFTINDILFFPFTVHHDAIEPVGFKIVYQDKSVGICTDVGFVSSYLIDSLKCCDCLFLESNHDIEMVINSKKPPFYKKRVVSRLGHLSNNECCRLIQSVSGQFTKSIILGHLSSECNDINLVKQCFVQTGLQIPLLVATQDKPTEVICIT